MEQVQNAMTEQRAHTDASLGAERAAADSGEHRSEALALRALDDLVERDRILADTRLLRFRDSADRLLARARSASPLNDGGVAQERRIADQGKKTEREDMDARLQSERQRSDVIVETERSEQETQRAQLEAHRQDTNDQLSSERHDTDATVTALGHTRDALALSEGHQERYDDVLGMVTHDLRSPLAVLMITAETIAEDTQEPATREAAQRMTRAAARMERLLADLLDVARIQSGALRITKRQYAVAPLVTEILKTYGPLFTDRGLTFMVDAPATAIVASFDYDRIVQVLSNLLGNAMKFTPRGGTVTLEVQQRAEHIEFNLRDNGPGICASALPHVFERFWQIASADRRGLGLGLYICEKIVAAHGGTIRAESEFGQGATLRFTLPVI
jgi:signal transduction histidine kinase